LFVKTLNRFHGHNVYYFGTSGGANMGALDERFTPFAIATKLKTGLAISHGIGAFAQT
jgi:hypothetical protein